MSNQGIQTHYLSVAETARLIRAALKSAFPGVKFSVRSEKYSGGCSVDVSWIDGPTVKEVDAVAGMFEGKRFDGMIDMAWTAKLWLLPDGTAMVASDPGSEGSMGTRAAVRQWMPHPDAKLICTGAYVFCRRNTSKEFEARIKGFIARRGGWQNVFGNQGGARDELDAVRVVSSRAKVIDGALIVARSTNSHI
jgi:hypothetical protein